MSALIPYERTTPADLKGSIAMSNRSALEWVIDQYQVSTDSRSGIVSDPNRADDPRSIVRLVGQVVRVSIETVRLVRELAAKMNVQAWWEQRQSRHWRAQGSFNVSRRPSISSSVMKRA